MTHLARCLALAAAALALAACGSQPDAPEAEPEPVADVAVEVVREGPIRQTITGYGTAVEEPGAGQTYTVPFEGVVQRVLVAAGQAVGAGTPLVRLAPSVTAQADLEQATLDLAAQRAALQTTQERYDLHLATRQELEAAQATRSAAEARYDALRRADAQTAVAAHATGVVDTVYVAPGQTVGAGAPLVAIAPASGFTLTLGVEAEDLASIQPGQAVLVEGVDRPEAARAVGRVRRVEQAVSAQTRLAQVIVELPGRNPFLLGEYVRGTFEGAETRALVAPRDALLPTADGLVAFTVEGGRAVRHLVRVVAETDSLSGFAGGGIRAGDSLIVSNLVQLSDSLRVRPTGEARPR